MYPFSTNKKTLFLKLSNDEIVSLLEKHIEDSHFFQIREDSRLYGKIKPNVSKFQIGQSPTFNSFRPIVVMRWKERGNNKLELNSYFRVDYGMIVFLLIPVIGAAKISFDIKSIIPLVLTIFLFLFLFLGIFQIIYRLSKKTTIKKVDKILDELCSLNND